MPKKSNKRSNKGKKARTRTRKQKPIIMIGCSNKKSCKKVFSILGNKSCPNCGPNCHCGPNCKCAHPCSGNCYLNRRIKKYKGGSGCGSCGCPMSPLSWNKMNQLVPGIGQHGGTCVPQSGGNFFKQIGPIPGTNIGTNWGSNINQWPGVNGIGGDKNYLAPVNTSANPQLQMNMNDSGYNTLNSMVGGYTYKNKVDTLSESQSESESKSKSRSRSSLSKTRKRGGGLIPQDLVNLGRDFTYNFKSAYNAVNGYKSPVDPAPYKGQLTGTLNTNKFFRT